MKMFCYQCQEAYKNVGCEVKGVCGKTDEVANLQDLLVWLLKGVSYWAAQGRGLDVSSPEADRFVAEGLFATITNVNFDPQRFVELIQRALSLRDALKARGEKAGFNAEDLPLYATWLPLRGDVEELATKGFMVGIMSDHNLNEDIRSLRELLVYGLKGMAAYVDHACLLDFSSTDLFCSVFWKMGCSRLPMTAWGWMNW